jgi:hypothetical protein
MMNLLNLDLCERLITSTSLPRLYRSLINGHGCVSKHVTAGPPTHSSRLRRHNNHSGPVDGCRLHASPKRLRVRAGRRNCRSSGLRWEECLATYRTDHLAKIDQPIQARTIRSRRCRLNGTAPLSTTRTVCPRVIAVASLLFIKIMCRNRTMPG